ncbi:MAG: hypothetical protein BYD32DRAFT_402049 [Podila humilis]|nr:MAG: hypothetical protein BYD32DRAFT_402049 [Podila humilis]
MLSMISIFDIVLIADWIAGYLTLQDILACTLVSHCWRNLFGPHRWKVIHALNILLSDASREALRPHTDRVRTAHLDLDTEINLLKEFAFATWCPNVQDLKLVGGQAYKRNNHPSNAEILNFLDQAAQLTTLELTWYNCQPSSVQFGIQYLKPSALSALAHHTSLTNVTLNLQYNLSPVLIPQILCSLPLQIQFFKFVTYSLLDLNDNFEDHDDNGDPPTPPPPPQENITTSAVLATKSHPSLTQLFLDVDCTGHEREVLMPFFRTCPSLRELHLAPMRNPRNFDDNATPILADTILKHCPQLSKMTLAPKYGDRRHWSAVSLHVLAQATTIQHLQIDGVWGQSTPPISSRMLQRWATTLTTLEFVNHSLVNTTDLRRILVQCENLRVLRTTKGWGGHDCYLEMCDLNWDRCGVHVEELLAEPWRCMKLETVSLILVECTRKSPREEDEATQRRIARKVVDLHRRLMMLENLQVLELFWYFPYLERMGEWLEGTWYHPMGRMSQKVLAHAIPRHEQSLMGVEWTEFPGVEVENVEHEDEDEDEGGNEYQMYKSRLRHQRACKANFKKFK